MKRVHSADNRIYKLCVKLGQKKYRDQLCKYIVEGENLVQEALGSSCGVDHIIVHETHYPIERIAARYEGAADDEVNTGNHLDRTVFMKGSLFEKIAQTKTSRGILAVVDKPEMTAEQFVAQAEKKGDNLIVLDRLQDPGNLGTIIRTADAAGYGGIVAIKGTGDIYGPKVVRAAAGSLFRVPVLYVETAKDAVDLLKNNGKKIVSTCFDTKQYYYDTDLARNIALVIGNEGKGISKELLDISDEKIKIPMEGSIDSLNAAVAAGILMYHSMLQKRTRDRE